MSSKSNFNIDYFSIRMAFDEAKVLLDENRIDMFEYRSLLNRLLKEVKEIDRNYNNDDVRELLNNLINGQRNETTK